MDMRKITRTLIMREKFVVAGFAILFSGGVSAKPPSDLLWSSGYDRFCNGPCISVFQGEKGVTLEIVDPANGKAKFIRQVSLPHDAVLGPPRALSEVDTTGAAQSSSDAQVAPMTVPSPPSGGSGVTSVESPIHDGYGHIVGSVIVYYIFQNGVIVEVLVDTIIISNHNHEQR